MLISPAYAQAGGQAAGNPIGMIIMLGLIVLIFYFLLIRPQQKRMKQHRDMVASLRRGDRVVTGGGLVGTITKASDDDYITVEIAEGTRVQVQKNTIQSVLSKTEPAKSEGGGKAKSSGQDSSGNQSGEGGKSGLGKLIAGKK